jgi:hypothetical protein
MGQFSFGGWGSCPQEMLDKHKKVSVSGIAECYESPAHFESRYILKEGEETDAMKLGTAIHVAVLEPEKFDKLYCVEPDVMPEGILETADQMKAHCIANNLKVSGSKADLLARLIDAGYLFKSYDQWIEEHCNGRTLLKKKEYQACIRIRQRVADNNGLSYFVNDGTPEMLGWALHERTGLIVSFKMDYFKTLAKPVQGCEIAVMDLKKVRSVKKRKFEQLIWERNMYIQAALYVDLIEALTNKKALFLWLAVESAPPYVVMGYPVDLGLLEAGRNEYNKTLNTLVDCFATNKWPVYSNELQTVTLPNYAWNALEVRDDEYDNES